MKKTFFERISVNPNVMVGKPVFKGTRIPISVVLDLVGDGIDYKEIVRAYPDISIEDIKAAIKYASLQMNRVELYETA